MKKRKSRVILALLAGILLLGACTDVPDNVKEDIEKRNENKENQVKDNQIKEENNQAEEIQTDQKRIPIKQIVDKTPAKWQDKSGIAHFDGSVYIPKDLAKLYLWKVKVNEEAFQNQEKGKEVFLKYFDNLEREKVYTYDGEKTPFINYNEYSDEEDSSALETGEAAPTDGISFGKNGSISMVMLTDYWKNTEEGNKWKVMPVNGELAYTANYKLDQEGNCLEGGEESYQMYDGKQMTPQDAADYFMETIKDLKKVMPSVDFYADRVGVFKNEAQDCYILEAYGGVQFEDVPVDNAVLMEQDILRYGNVCRLNNSLTQVFQKGTFPPYWTVLDSCYRPVEKLETYDEIIDFETAWSLLKRHMADEKEVVITRADLIYSVYYEPKGDTDMMWWYTMEDQPEMFATPVWRFVSYQNAQTSYAYYVDAITGQVMSYAHAVL